VVALGWWGLVWLVESDGGLGEWVGREVLMCAHLFAKKCPWEKAAVHVCTVDKKQEGRGGVESTTLRVPTGKNKKQKSNFINQF
jgi:hypothetical protein